MSNMIKVVVGVGAIALAPLGTGCQSKHVDPGWKDTAARTLAQVHGSWKVETINGKPVNPAVAAPTLEMRDEGKIGGRAPVNHWSTTIDEEALGRGEVRLGAVITTLMAGPPEAMGAEREFLEALGRAARIDPGALNQGILRMVDDQGTEVLRFVRP